MLTIFNRRELIITFDMKKQAAIRELLFASGIEYYVRVVNRRSPSAFAAGTRGPAGTAGENLQLHYEYIFYVRKSDYDRALGLLHTGGHL